MVTQVKDYGLQFHPRKREILICDFAGNIVPEIVKKRPVVVLRDPLPYRSDLACSVSLKRLDRIKVGKRKYVCPRMNEDDFANVVRGVGWVFGFTA